MSAPVVRHLRPEDAADAARLAREAFGGNGFYERAMGFGAPEFAVFWEEFFRLALGDARCRVFGIAVAGELEGALVITFRGFPATPHGAAYLRRLLGRLGPRRVLRYLRFVRAYDRAMHRPAHEEEREGRSYWLFVSPGASVRGLGSRLVRAGAGWLAREGYTVATGFVDAGNGPLLRFYRRLGFTVGPAFPFFGARAVRIELPTARFLECAP